MNHFDTDTDVTPITGMSILDFATREEWELAYSEEASELQLRYADSELREEDEAYADVDQFGDEITEIIA